MFSRRNLPDLLGALLAVLVVALLSPAAGLVLAVVFALVAPVPYVSLVGSTSLRPVKVAR